MSQVYEEIIDSFVARRSNNEDLPDTIVLTRVEWEDLMVSMSPLYPIPEPSDPAHRLYIGPVEIQCYEVSPKS